MSIKKVANPPNPYTHYSMEWLDVPPAAKLEVFEEDAKSILTENASPDVPFRFTVNPYRGCFHGCAYCYARPTHQYIDFGAGSDFERKIVVKVNAPQLLALEFGRRSWNGEMIVFSGVTDCYQPLEASYQITRRCLEVCERFQNPLSITTKGVLIERDIDLLQSLKKFGASVYFSIPFLSDAISKDIEPSAPRSSRRFKAMKALADAGIPVGIGIAPLIPGLNDSDIPGLIARAAGNGASSAFMLMLRLPAEVREVFLQRLHETCPDKEQKVISSIKELRGGELTNPRFFERFEGQGEKWKAIQWMFEQSAKQHGLRYSGHGEEGRPRKRSRPEQLSLNFSE